MSKNNSAYNGLIIAAVISVAVALFFTVVHVKIKKNTAANTDVVEINERMFATQVSDVYLNAEDYLGKTIKLEGIFKKEQVHVWDDPNCFVVRYGPGGCCGIDANVGFEVKWQEGRVQPYPSGESWVEAAGELKVDEEGFYLYLDLASLTVLDKRGREFVSQ